MHGPLNVQCLQSLNTDPLLKTGDGRKKLSYESRKFLVAAATLTNEKSLHEIRFVFLEDRNVTSAARPVTLKRFA